MQPDDAPREPLPASPGDSAAAGADKPRTLWRDAWATLKRNKTALVCMCTLIVYVIIGLLGFTPQLNKLREERVGGSNQPSAIFKVDDKGNKSVEPGLWFGTDFL